jgi:hypothetical protein
LTLPSIDRITCWRVMHGVLGCNAFICHKRTDLPKEDALCPHLCCRAVGVAGGAVETLSHAFMECPAVQPAVTWLCDLWKAFSGEELPRDAAVLG